MHTAIEWASISPPCIEVFGAWRGLGTEGRWNGDAFGNEWVCGYCIYSVLDELSGQTVFELYEDDGNGNGDLLGTFSSLAFAQRAANAHNMKSWLR